MEFQPLKRSTAQRGLAALFAASALLLWSGDSQAFPDRVVTIVTTVAAGGSIDAVARTVAQGLSDELKGTVIVEPRPGAGGNTAASFVSKAPADGHTILFAASSTLAINPHLYKSPPFDADSDFEIIALPARVNQILVVNPKLGVSSAKDFIERLKSTSSQLSYGTSGIGSLSHLTSEVLALRTGGSPVHIPYRGIAPAMTDLLAAQIDFMFDSATSIPNIKDGKLKALAVVGPKRLAGLPDVPTLHEAGITGMEFTNGWYVVAVPKATPRAVVDLLSSKIRDIMKSDRSQKLIADMGLETTDVPASEMTGIIASDRRQVGEALATIKIEKY